MSQISAAPHRVRGRFRASAGAVGKGGPKTDGFLLWMGDASAAVHRNGERLTNMIARRKR